VDEIELFEELRPPPPPDAPRIREAARARLTAAMNVSPPHPARRRRSTVAAVAAAAALVAAGTGYGLTAARDGGGPRPGPVARSGPSSSPSPPRGTAAGLTAVHGCPGKFVTTGTLEQVSGTQLIVQPPNRAQPVTVATSSSTAITRPVSGTVSDITDGSQVLVQGTWSGGTLAAAQVGIEVAMPTLPGPALPSHPSKLAPLPNGGLGPPIANGTVVDAHNGSFTVITRNPIPGTPVRVQVITSPSTTVLANGSTSASQLDLGANVVAVGTAAPDGVLTASTVAEPSVVPTLVAGGLVKLRPSGCSASAVSAAAILASG
jgi:Domain of unknown function (DUF5666)